ncbi:MAG: hypothetical protein V1798_05270 [Pseudomonadota bacterium]
MRLFFVIALVLAMVAVPERILADPAEDSANIGAVYSGKGGTSCPNGPGAQKSAGPGPVEYGKNFKVKDTYCPPPDFWGHGSFVACHTFCTKPGNNCPTN